MNQTAMFRFWNWMVLAVALLPLAIFWAGRGEVGDTGRHSVVSGIYLLAVVATIVWVRTRRTATSVVAALVAVAASVGSAIGFVDLARDQATEAGIASLPTTMAAGMLVLIAASNAAWVGLFSLTLAIRNRRVN